MMSKKIEEFIRENKRAFDMEEPPAHLWNKIEEQLGGWEAPKKKLNRTLWLSIAASLIVVLGITGMLTYKAKAPVSLADVNPDYAKKQMQFASLIEEKKDSLEVLSKINPALYNKFNQDIERMDRDYQKLKKELGDSPNQKMVVKAMVKNLELQLQVITQQLTIINQVNEYKKENSI